MKPKTFEIVGIAPLTVFQRRLVKPAWDKAHEDGGSVIAQVFPDGLRVVRLTRSQARAWQKYVGNLGLKRSSASGSAFK